MQVKPPMNNAISRDGAWQALVTHQAQMQTISLAQLFAKDPQRFNEFSLNAGGILLDFSKNHITQETVALLVQLAESANLSASIHQLLTGELINFTEDRKVLHPLLRAKKAINLVAADAAESMKKMQATLARAYEFAEKVRAGHWRGFTGKPIRHVVNLGIGGSYLGPQLVSHSLKPYHDSNLDIHFLASVDGAAITELLAALDPESTLFIIASKSFSTTETLHNAIVLKAWLNQQLGNEHAFQAHFVAVSANENAACEFGILPEHYFPLVEEVGGRYSLWSAMGLAPMLAIGQANFESLLRGAAAMDEHFHHAPLSTNMPVILGLVGIWYRNFFHTRAHALLPYDHRLSYLPLHIQQLEMESNGKNRDRNNDPVAYETAPIIWGGDGCLAQHSFYQWFHQGTDMITCDFFMSVLGDEAYQNHHDLLFANCLGRSLAFSQGYERDAPYQQIIGNRPSNTLLFPRLTPEILGALIALYEHKVFVQGVLWGINSFDQWGIEFGKQISKKILRDLSATASESYDSSTRGLMAYYQRIKGLES